MFNKNKKEPLTQINGQDILTKPIGHNNMSSRSLFIQRKTYEQILDNHSLFLKNKPLDILYTNLFFGRIIEDGIIIEPKQEFIKTFPQAFGKNIFALNFVIDAFIDFKKDWLGLVQKDKINTDSKIVSLNIKNSFINVENLYLEFMKIYYKKFKNFVKQNKKDKQILGFESFLKIYSQFLDQETPFLPILFSSFIKSRFNTPLSTGLVLDISNENCGNDKNKFIDWFDDTNFESYKIRAQRYGFILDKNIPWRLYFDHTSIAATKYLKKYNIEETNMFNIVFQKSSIKDIEILKNILAQFYNIYISKRKSFILVNTKNCLNNINNISLSFKKIKRDKINREELDKAELDKLIHRFYVFVLGREKNLNWNQEFFEHIVENSISLKHRLDFFKSLMYTLDKTGNSRNASQKEHGFKF